MGSISSLKLFGGKDREAWIRDDEEGIVDMMDAESRATGRRKRGRPKIRLV